MKRTVFLLIALLGAGPVLDCAAQSADNITPGVSVDYFNIDRDGKYLTVDMTINLESLEVGANRAVLLTPRLVNGTDSLDLPSIGIYGRNRYFYYKRNGVNSISGDEETSFRSSSMLDDVDYHKLVLYEDWMDGSVLCLHRSDWGCCHQMVAEYDGRLGTYEYTEKEFFPELIFIRPDAEVMKIRSLSGSAFIDFPVDQTIISPEYRRNAVELEKIHATIDSVRNDSDVSIVSVWLKGYASPESPYSHNTELAMGRTSALKDYICQLYSFSPELIITEYEPEDWIGLRRYVEASNLDNRKDILELIDSDMDPDAKESQIKRTYPEQYLFLLRHCYPALRHTDYRIEYKIRSFSEVEEIKRIMSESPQKLSLNELYLVARTYEPGTDEFTDVFDLAVRMYPNDEAANLNAANAAIRRDDFVSAGRYLQKAGDSAEADYARGALAIRRKEYEAARLPLARAGEKGLEKASVLLKWLDGEVSHETE